MSNSKYTLILNRVILFVIMFTIGESWSTNSNATWCGVFPISQTPKGPFALWSHNDEYEVNVISLLSRDLIKVCCWR
jgi:hypothetical protein